MPFVGDVVRHNREAIVIDLHQNVDAAFSDGETRYVRQKIIADEEAKKDEIIQNSFEVVSESHFGLVKHQMQKLPHKFEVEVLKLHVDGVGIHFVL
jgi:hypothetical protein